MELLLNVDAGDVMSSLLGSPEDITCTSPFLWLNTIGYIQCQRECIRYSICDLLQFKTDQLECRLYVASSCDTTPDPNIYLRRTDIKESVFKGCDREGCPTSTCIGLRGGQHTCVLDKEAYGPVFGERFSKYCMRFLRREACDIKHAKENMDADNRNASKNVPYLLVGAYKDNGQARWATGETVQSTKVVIRDEGSCFVLQPGDYIIDVICNHPWPFICELPSGI